MDYIFDGSFNGYLCCVFEAFERKEFLALPSASGMAPPDLFCQTRTIHTDLAKSKRVHQAMERMLGKKEMEIFYYNFLADEKEAWAVGFKLMVRLFKNGRMDMYNYGDPDLLKLHQIVKKVNRERHRVKAFVRFVKSSDELYTAVIEPDFNVLPLVITFFKNRFSDQRWLIYDIRRAYGYHYDGKQVHEVTTSEGQDINDPHALSIHLDSKELEFQHLWKTYFKSTNIQERKNIKLHLRHVPKRYWKYLTEKR